MKNRLVNELMVPLAEYAHVREDATLFEAVAALEKTQQQFTKSPFPHRAILVTNAAGDIVGKISLIDAMRAMEPRYDEFQDKTGLAHLGFTKKFIQSMVKTYNLWSGPLDHICQKGAERIAKDFMHVPDETEYVDINEALNVAAHQLIIGHHQSLLVTQHGKVVGVLRLTDVFASLADLMKQCKL